MTDKGFISRRKIGDVDIFDIEGSVKAVQAKKINNYLSAYFRNGNVRFGILNVQGLVFIDNNVIGNIVESFRDLEKSVLYYSHENISEIFKSFEGEFISKFMSQEREVVQILGSELTRPHGKIPEIERRKSPRFKTALSVDFSLKESQGREGMAAGGIITNLNESGCLIECLDLGSASLVQQMDYFKDLEIRIQAHDAFYVFQKMQGEVVRIEISGKHTALAVKFFSDIAMPADK